MGPIRVFLPGEPRSTQTGTIARAGTRAFPTRMNTAWSRACAVRMKAALVGRALPVFTGPVVLEMAFYFARPKKGIRERYPTRRVDVGNLEKGLLDAWNRILWADDAQIVKCTTSKLWASEGGRPGVLVIADEAYNGGPDD